MYSRKYHGDSDATLINSYRAGDESACTELILRYANMINRRCYEVNISGVDIDDVKQEAYMGLLNAIRTFDSNKSVAFAVYANVCIKNSVKNLLISSLTNKVALNRNAVSLDEIGDSFRDNDFMSDPEAVVLQKEEFSQIQNKIDASLSKLERKTLFLYLGGRDYITIAKIMCLSQKSVDNALCRARKKLKKVLNEI